MSEEKKTRDVWLVDVSGYPFYDIGRFDVDADTDLTGTVIDDPWGGRWHVLMDHAKWPLMGSYRDELFHVWCVPIRDTHPHLNPEGDPKRWKGTVAIEGIPRRPIPEDWPAPSFLRSVPPTNTFKVWERAALT